MSRNARRTAERRRHHAARAGERAGPAGAVAGATTTATGEREPPAADVWWAWSLRWIAVVSFLGAELVHWTVIDSHREEWAAAGTFFLVLSVVEAVLTFALIVSLTRWVIVASIVANVVPIAVWAWDRTLGLPFGPDAGRRGQVGRADLVSVVLELVAIGALIPFLTSPELIEQARHGSRRGAYAIAVVGAYVVFVVGYAALGESGRFHDPAGAASSDPGSTTTIATIDAAGDASTAAGDDVGSPALVPAQTIDVSMVDFAYVLPDTLPAAVTDLHLVNDGAEPHEVIVGRLREDVPEDELPADVFVEMIFGKSDVIPMGQSGEVAPGDSVDLVVDLGTPGRYVLACNIASPDGSFHYLKGMASIIRAA